MALFQAKRFEGTYHQVPKVDWDDLMAHDFEQPDWTTLYPINPKTNLPTGLLSPRLACKLFHDGIFLVNKSEENGKFYQDKLPEAVHKYYKKKQFRKQCIESGRRVVCRLAKGLGFNPNCVAEEVFMYVLLKDAFEMGWRRIQQHVENLPENERDRDYNRVLRLVGGDDIAALYRGEAGAEAKPVKESKKPTKDLNGKDVIKTTFSDYRNWFVEYERKFAHDHEIHVEHAETIEAGK